ncbi:MAG: hypothetical protein E5X51_24485 [Mesorhizobium sp.]|uniref:hypothetical protein n=1 Tax=Mesorhizobium sp. TaxID=1871066 RepID=UPI00120A5FAD|nr:hypothetical protein [Mesorhizobium sp.]TIQ18749.1 MAG: hypothetical protein E5X51_24485 [Mesorhizobium sp.]
MTTFGEETNQRMAFGQSAFLDIAFLAGRQSRHRAEQLSDHMLDASGGFVKIDLLVKGCSVPTGTARQPVGPSR